MIILYFYALKMIEKRYMYFCYNLQFSIPILARDNKKNEYPKCAAGTKRLRTAALEKQ
jgi:hypothetical protein